MTIKDIARESGYSVGTVSRCLNNQSGVSERARVAIMEIVDKYGFEININAKHLKQTAKDGIAIIIKGTQNMLFASIVELLQVRIAEQGFVSTIYYLDENVNEVERAKTILRERNPQGFLFLGSNLAFFKEGFQDLDVPCVLVTNSGEGVGFHNLSSVSTNDVAAAQYAVEYLIHLDHREIAILGGITNDSVAADNRMIGAMKAFEENHLEFSKSTNYVEKLFSVENGYRGMEELLLKNNKITAVFAMSDTLAIGAIRAIIDHQLRVPEDISVVGFDGIDIGDYYSPRLTTIRQQQGIIAERSVDILMERIADQNLPPVYEVEPFHLIPGESVCRLEEKIHN